MINYLSLFISVICAIAIGQILRVAIKENHANWYIHVITFIVTVISSIINIISIIGVK